MSSSDQKGKKPSNAYSEKEQWEDDLDLPPIVHQKAKIKKPILEKAEFDKKRKTNIKPFIAIGSLLLMIGLYYLIGQNDQKQNPNISENSRTETSTTDNQLVHETQNVAQQEEKEQDKLNETWQEDTVIVEGLLKADVVQEELSVYESPKNYHIIVGSFQKENNAKNWLAKNSFKEYEKQSIREFSGWYRIIYQSYSSVDQAEIEIDSIRNNLNFKAWIAYME